MESSNNNILAVIPARQGSKSIPDKNISLIAGKPMLAYSIEHALSSSLISRTIVSTDSEIYAKIARDYGAEVPFLRPDEFAQDTSTDLDVFIHALSWLKENEGYIPDICVHLRPTYPMRDAKDIDNCINILISNPEIDSVRTVAPVKETPYKMWNLGDQGYLKPLLKTSINEPYNLPRQLLPEVYIQNACIDVVRAQIITQGKSMTGGNIYGYVMADNYDIDDHQQLNEADNCFKHKNCNKRNTIQVDDHSQTYCFDIDGVIATTTIDNQYDQAQPIRENIEIINSLFDQHHKIILFTARGTMTGINWTKITVKQLSDWGVRYHNLFFGKPAADYYIDDKFIPMDKLSQHVKGEKK